MREGFLSIRWVPRLESLRFRRVNVQKPREPHYERAKYLALVKPMYEVDKSAYLPPSVTCRKTEEQKRNTTRIDNPLERIIAKELYDKCESSKMVCFVHTNPISGEDQFQARVLLKRDNMEIGVYSKYTVATAFENTRYEAILPLFVTHTAIIFSQETNIDKLLKVLKKVPQYILMGGIIDNRLLSVTQLKKYSELKDITTARAQLVSVLNLCAQQTVSQLMAHPQRLIAQLQLHANSQKS